MRLITILTGLAMVSAPSPAVAVQARCFVRHARVLAKNAEAKIWRGRGMVQGCLRHHEPVVLARYTRPIDDSSDTISVRHLQLAGTFVAYEASCSCRSESYSVLRRRNLRRIHRRPEEVANTVASGANVPTTTIVLRPDGAMAWIGNDYFAEPDHRELWKSDGAGVGQLDSGDVIDDLRLVDDEVTWTKDGASYSRRLEPLD